MEVPTGRLLLLVLAAILVQPSFSQENRAPVFVETLQGRLQTKGVFENTPVGTFVGTISCTDPEGKGIVGFRVDSQTLRIDSQTGQVFINRLLDRENTPENSDEAAKIVRVTFYCSDADNLETSITFDITVLDVNDNPPRFTNRPYATSVPENATVGTTVMSTILVTDLDVNVNSRVTVTCRSVLQNESVATQASCIYFNVITRQAGLGKYEVSIVLALPVDFELRRDYSVPLFAQDQGTPSLNSSESVLISITDQQDTNPVFLNTPITLYVNESSALGTEVSTRISAQDGDRGNPRPLRLAIMEDPDGLFRMGSSVRSVDLTGETYSAPVFVNAVIDREKYRGTYQFKVNVTELDGGVETTATATTVVTVSVFDINDNVPTFSSPSYTVNLSESNNQVVGNDLQVPDLNIQVTDLDDASNAVYFVRIRSQTFETFRVYPINITGNAILNMLVNNVTFLDYDIPAYRRQTIVLEAVEYTANPKTSSTTVTINLQDVNDNFPVFTVSNLNTTIPENTAVGTSILAVTAIDRDSGQNGNVTYIIRGSNSQTFNVNPITGVVTLARAVDFETQALYALLFEAVDQGRPQRVERKTVYIRISNINDVAPVFTQSQYLTYAFESSLNLTPAVTVTARDPEEGSSFGISYRIQGDNPQNSFNLDSRSGSLTLVRKLDFDNTPGRSGQFLLTIIAVDSVLPYQTGTTTVTINVRDENNNSPVFLTTNVFKNISELATTGLTVASLSATDADRGTNGEIRYQIATGNLDHFIINPDTGVISVSSNAKFDYDEFPRYRMIVYAIDKGSPPLSGTATVSVDLLDANNKAPYFSQGIYSRSLPESTPIGSSVIDLEATDPDTSSRLVYEISINSIIARNNGGGIITSLSPFDYQRAFRIDNSTGLITTNSALKRDYAAKISFQVFVKDLAALTQGQTATTSVLVTILGTNVSTVIFNPPWTPERPEYRISVTENRAVFSFLTTVGARDPACGYCLVNNYLMVPQSDPNGYFSVERQSGRIRVDKLLDYEKLNPKTLSFEVDAITSDRRSARATVFVEVTDDNDNSPAFERSSYVFSVSESSQFPSTVGYVSAIDADSGSFGQMTYSLSGQSSEDFIIISQANRGRIYIARGKELDFESRKVYNLLITASDNPSGGTSKLRRQTSVPLTIHILDVNDNMPVFSNDSSYVFFTVESYSRGAKIGTVTATDLDQGTNGEVTYSVASDTNVDAFSLFQVGLRNGIITTRKELRGTSIKSPYRFIVRAEDRGSPPLMNTVQITIHVTSGQLDDGTPYWSRPEVDQIFTLYEHSPLNTNITVVEATARTPNASVRYSWLSSGDPLAFSKFDIDPVTGRVYVIGDLDREEQELYSLIVAARDTINTTKESYRRVTIRLLDIPDKVPSFTECPDKRLPMPVIVKLMENVPVGTFVYTVEACDRDLPPYNKILYSPEFTVDICRREMEGGFFTVHPNGTITTNRTMDREFHEEFLICVRASQDSSTGRRKRAIDLSKVNNTGEIAYVIVKLSDLNDNAPVFPSNVQTAILSIFPDSGTIVAVSATDADESPYNRVRYVRVNTTFYRKDGNSHQVNTAFIVNSDTGEVTTNYPTYVDYTLGYFDVVIRAEDFYDSSKHSYMTLKIYVYNPSQSFRLLLNEPPRAGQETAKLVLRDLNAVNPQKVFRLEAVAAHRTGKDGMDITRTDVCFVYISSDTSSVQSVVRTYSTLRDSSSYDDVLRRYGSTASGSCYASQTSRDNIKWQDLWWVLVAVGIFIFICTVILILVICILYNNYKYNMKQRTYMVPS